MKAELVHVRGVLLGALNMIDAILAADTSGEPTDVSKFRTSPGGPLSDAGIVEMYRRFEASEPDAIIARAMGVSVQGVQKRRAIWKKG